MIMASTHQAVNEVIQDQITGELSRSRSWTNHVGPGAPWDPGPACPWVATV